MEHLLKPRPFFYIRQVVEPVKKASLDLRVDNAIAFRLVVNYMYVMLFGLCRISLSYSSYEHDAYWCRKTHLEFCGNFTVNVTKDFLTFK